MLEASGKSAIGLVSWNANALLHLDAGRRAKRLSELHSPSTTNDDVAVQEPYGDLVDVAAVFSELGLSVLVSLPSG